MTHVGHGPCEQGSRSRSREAELSEPEEGGARLIDRLGQERTAVAVGGAVVVEEPEVSAAGPLEEEPALAPGLAACPNAVIVPHIASATTWTRAGMATMAACNVAAILRGDPVASELDISEYLEGASPARKATMGCVRSCDPDAGVSRNEQAGTDRQFCARNMIKAPSRGSVHEDCQSESLAQQVSDVSAALITAS